ncbi:hypothetical protein, conserved, partial [Eimeria tenella]
VIDAKTGERKASVETPFPVKWLALTERVLLFLLACGELYLLPFAAAADQQEQEQQQQQQQQPLLLLSCCSKAELLMDDYVLVAQTGDRTICIWYNIEDFRRVELLGVEGLLLGFVFEVEKEKKKKMEKWKVADTPQAPTVAALLLLLQQQEVAAAAAASLWQRLRDSILDFELFKPFNSSWGAPLDGGGPPEGLWGLQQRLAAAAVAAAAAGDAATAKFIRKINKRQNSGNKETQETDKAFLMLKAGSELSAPYLGAAALKGQFAAAEALLLQQGAAAAAVEMHRQLYR